MQQTRPRVAPMTTRKQSLFSPACLATAALLALAMLAGCDTSAPPPTFPTQPAATQTESPFEEPPQQAPTQPLAPPELPSAATPASSKHASVEPLAEPSDGGEIVEETWEAYSLQGSHVGYAHTTIAKAVEGGHT